MSPSTDCPSGKGAAMMAENVNTFHNIFRKNTNPSIIYNNFIVMMCLSSTLFDVNL